MASTFSTSLRLSKQGTGDNPNSWGTVLNEQVISLVDNAIAGIETINATGSGDITLTTNNGSADQARKAILLFTGTPASNRNIVVPALSKTYVIFNRTTTNNLVFKASGSAVEITVASGEKAFIFCDGADLFELINTGNLIPPGLIALWSGTIANIPSGWVLCDGTNGTPDLQDKFVVGASSDDSGVAKTNITGSLTTTGGSAQPALTTEVNGAHSHTGFTGFHTLVLNEIPSHTHSYTLSTISSVRGDGQSQTAVSLTTSTTGAAGGDQGHRHTISSDGSHAHTFTTELPPYYAQAFIMKT